MRVTVRWNQTAEAGLYRVVGYVDGRKELDTHYRFQTEQALRGCWPTTSLMSPSG